MNIVVAFTLTGLLWMMFCLLVWMTFLFFFLVVFNAIHSIMMDESMYYSFIDSLLRKSTHLLSCQVFGRHHWAETP